jgi:hypothetical protein
MRGLSSCPAPPVQDVHARHRPEHVISPRHVMMSRQPHRRSACRVPTMSRSLLTLNGIHPRQSLPPKVCTRAPLIRSETLFSVRGGKLGNRRHGAPYAALNCGARRVRRQNLRQPCHHSQFHAALPCNPQKCSLLPLCREHSLQHIETIGKVGRQQEPSPCNFGKLPCKSPIAGKIRPRDHFASDCILRHAVGLYTAPRDTDRKNLATRANDRFGGRPAPVAQEK